MRRSMFVGLMLSLFLLLLGAFPGHAAPAGGVANQADPEGGQVIVRERGFGVSRVDYTRCVEFCAQALPEGSAERRTCIAGCSHIDSSFEVDSGLLGAGSGP